MTTPNCPNATALRDRGAWNRTAGNWFRSVIRRVIEELQPVDSADAERALVHAVDHADLKRLIEAWRIGQRSDRAL
jgi:hypothetical protein